MTALPGKQWMDALAAHLENELVPHGVLVTKESLRAVIEQYAPVSVEPIVPTASDITPH